MKHILLMGPNGLRKVPEGEPYRLEKDEYITGFEHTNEIGEQTTQYAFDVESALEKQGIPWGDAVAWVTKRMGVQQCSSCKSRQEILNTAGKLVDELGFLGGIKELSRQIKSTFKS